MIQHGSLIDIMPSRLDGIRDAIAGYRETGVPLISLDGNMLEPAGAGSDIGMFYFVPKISTAFGLAPAAATEAFLLGVLVFGLLTGGIASFLLFRRWAARAAAWFALGIIAIVAFVNGDQYVIAPAIAMTIVPWFLHLYRKRVRDRDLGLFLFSAGLLIGLAHITRAHSATAVALFVGVVLLLSAERLLVRRWLLLLPLAAGALVGPLYFHHLVGRRDAYLSAQRPDYAVVAPAHVLWHSVYIGFSYIDNPHVPAYRDEVAMARVEAVAPGTAYVSRQYERVLRAEVIRLAFRDPAFVVKTLFAKLGVICLYLLTFANIGLLAAVRRPNSRPIEVAFWVALAFSSLHGLLVLPVSSYLSGFIAFAALYGVVSWNAILEASPRMRFWDVLYLKRRLGTE